MVSTLEELCLKQLDHVPDFIDIERIQEQKLNKLIKDIHFILAKHGYFNMSLTSENRIIELYNSNLTINCRTKQVKENYSSIVFNEIRNRLALNFSIRYSRNDSYPFYDSVDFLLDTIPLFHLTIKLNTFETKFNVSSEQIESSIIHEIEFKKINCHTCHCRHCCHCRYRNY